MSLDRDIQFLYEIGNLRFIARQWKRFLNADFANLAEHHLRVAWLALIIAKYESAKNTEKILKMALVHDIAESRTGDVDYLSRQYTKRNEELGIKDMLKDTGLEAEFLELWHEYEKKESIESQIVKDADYLDVDMEIREQAAKGFVFEDMIPDDKERAELRNKILYTQTAKKIYEQIQKSNPHDWHVKGRNRLNAGDWKL